MRSGKLRHYGILQEKSITRDAMGGDVITWVDRVTDVPMEIIPLSGKNLDAAQQVHPELTARIRLRYHPDITPQWRVKYGARVFSIIGPPINRGERNHQLELNVTEGLLDG